MTERFITSTLNKRDPAKETSLRPPKFADFPGQEKVKDQLELFVAALQAYVFTILTCIYLNDAIHPGH